MLTQLCVHNYTLVDNLNLELNPGLTTLTGETGAGKSLLLDAIGLAIGNKPRGEAIANSDENAEVTATFDIRELPKTQRWLLEQELPVDTEDCLLKRVITPQGRSRCFINGRAVTLQQLQALGQQLINIHGQHEHQALLNSSTQRRLLDHYGVATDVRHKVDAAYTHWKTISDQLLNAQQLANSQNAEIQLLKYQAEELRQLALDENEVQELEVKQKRIANAEQIQHLGQQIIRLSQEDDDSLQAKIHWICTQLTQLGKHNPAFHEIQALYQTALIHIQEANNSLEAELQDSDSEGSELYQIEERLSAIYTMARKHKVSPSALYEHQMALFSQLDALDHSDERLNELELQVQGALKDYHLAAAALTEARTKASNSLRKAVSLRLADLNMKGADFVVELEARSEPSNHGNENVHFLISTLPGKPAAALQKIASGGELSRIGLAIQVITATKNTTPTLIFDEVDAGIGGTTGDVVGRLLRELGSKAQVLCVTHLAQVASKAHNHLQVNKTIKKGSAFSSISPLRGEEVINEIARMIGGPVETETSLAHARQMVSSQ